MDSNYINLGPVGSYPPYVVWLAIAILVIVALGFGYLCYKRTRKQHSNTVEDEEEAMVVSRNKAGWFGEKKLDFDSTEMSIPAAAAPQPASNKSRPAISATAKPPANQRQHRKQQSRGSGRRSRDDVIDSQTKDNSESSNSSEEDEIEKMERRRRRYNRRELPSQRSDSRSTKNQREAKKRADD
jgi:hypothetical protein